MLNIVAQVWYKILVVSAILLVLALYLTSLSSQSDLLAYIASNPPVKTSLRLYDPQHRLSAPALANIDTGVFSFSADGRIAFVESIQGQIIVLNIHSADTPPVQISQNATTRNYPIAWSPDGRYLAFQAIQDNPIDRLLYVWDGEKSINITPTDMDDNAERYDDVSWSPDGRLAFTVGLGITSTYQPSEIYLWDGRATINVSQNPTGEDHAPAWSADGRLAFVSERNRVYDILVWDGVSVKNGSPDVDSFANIAPELTTHFSFPKWTNTGLLAFESIDSQGINTQIYQWDGQQAINISLNPTLNNANPQWSRDGRWAFIAFFSSQRLLYVRDGDNHTLFTTPGQSAPRGVRTAI